MTTTINASTSAGLVQTADTSGILQLQTGGTTAVTISAGQVATFAQAPVLPAASIPQAALAAGVAGTGPAFSAYPSSTQTVTQSTWTKLACNTEEFDTNSNYDTTNYRFTPTVAGYYQVIGSASVTTITQTYNQLAIYKNGSRFKDGIISSASGSYYFSIFALIYLNGSTDYIELYGQTTGGTPTFSAGPTATFFQASMVRSA
jgi:hypothetical protein